MSETTAREFRLQAYLARVAHQMASPRDPVACLDFSMWGGYGVTRVQAHRAEWAALPIYDLLSDLFAKMALGAECQRPDMVSRVTVLLSMTRESACATKRAWATFARDVWNCYATAHRAVAAEMTRCQETMTIAWYCLFINRMLWLLLEWCDFDGERDVLPRASEEQIDSIVGDWIALLNRWCERLSDDAASRDMTAPSDDDDDDDDESDGKSGATNGAPPSLCRPIDAALSAWLSAYGAMYSTRWQYMDAGGALTKVYNSAPSASPTNAIIMRLVTVAENDRVGILPLAAPEIYVNLAACYRSLRNYWGVHRPRLPARLCYAVLRALRAAEIRCMRDAGGSARAKALHKSAVLCLGEAYVEFRERVSSPKDIAVCCPGNERALAVVLAVGDACGWKFAGASGERALDIMLDVLRSWDEMADDISRKMGYFDAELMPDILKRLAYAMRRACAVEDDADARECRVKERYALYAVIGSLLRQCPLWYQDERVFRTAAPFYEQAIVGCAEAIARYESSDCVAASSAPVRAAVSRLADARLNRMWFAMPPPPQESSDSSSSPSLRDCDTVGDTLDWALHEMRPHTLANAHLDPLQQIILPYNALSVLCDAGRGAWRPRKFSTYFLARVRAECARSVGRPVEVARTCVSMRKWTGGLSPPVAAGLFKAFAELKMPSTLEYCAELLVTACAATFREADPHTQVTRAIARYKILQIARLACYPKLLQRVVQCIAHHAASVRDAHAILTNVPVAAVLDSALHARGKSVAPVL